MSDTITKPENVTTSAGRDDAITSGASPRPWRVNGHTIEANDPEGLWLQNKKTGWGVVANLPSCPKSRMSKKNRETWDAIVDANAALIVAAVNKHGMPIVELVKACDALEAERDRLRDIVRRLADRLSSRTLAVVCTPGTRGDETAPDYDLIDEARAAAAAPESPTSQAPTSPAGEAAP